MPIKVAINGYGRIGRNVLRALYEEGRSGDIEIVAINDLGDAETNAHLTRFDTAHGRFPGSVEVDGDHMVVNGDRVRVCAERDPSKLPWGELGVDVVLECTGLFADGVPAITTQLRGLVGEEVTITGPDRDLHSGMFGGLAMNPARLLARALAGLHDETGRITLPGFYDGVPELDPELARQWAALDFDAAAFLGAVGLSAPAGETGRTPLEMLWSQPTCEINGMWSGYTGAGFKTVLPSTASAKVSFRLVGDQDPEVVRKAFRDHVRAALPPDCTAAFTPHGGAPASRMATDHPAFGKARRAVSAEWPAEAAFVGSGGSIPVAGHLKEMLGMDSMLIGFARDDDGIHSPNEKYDVDSFHRGTRSWARILAALSE